MNHGVINLAAALTASIIAAVAQAGSTCKFVEFYKGVSETNVHLKCTAIAHGYVQNDLKIDSVVLMIKLKNHKTVTTTVSGASQSVVDYVHQAQVLDEVAKTLEDKSVKVEDVASTRMVSITLKDLPEFAKKPVTEEDAAQKRKIASKNKRIQVSGPITAFTDKTVTILNKGSEIEVPRKSIPRYYKIRTGFEVTAYTDKEPTKTKKN